MQINTSKYIDLSKTDSKSEFSNKKETIKLIVSFVYITDLISEK